MSRWKLAWRQTRRDMAAGEVRLMVLALMLAVMAVTAVGMLTERAEFGLRQEANRLLGGDAALRADTPCSCMRTRWRGTGRTCHRSCVGAAARLSAWLSEH